LGKSPGVGVVKKRTVEIADMSTVDANRVILTGENSVIRLSNNDSDTFTTNATSGASYLAQAGRAMFSISKAS